MLKKRKILMVDDDPSVLKSLSEILKENYQLVFAENAKECFGIIKTQNVDLVILDLKLPDQSGLDVLKEIKFLCCWAPLFRRRGS